MSSTATHIRSGVTRSRAVNSTSDCVWARPKSPRMKPAARFSLNERCSSLRMRRILPVIPRVPRRGNGCSAERRPTARRRSVESDISACTPNSAITAVMRAGSIVSGAVTHAVAVG